MPWENPGSVEITTHTTAAGYLRHERRVQTLDATGLAELPGVTRATVDRDLQFALAIPPSAATITGREQG
jgi:hypothetical protein